MELQENVIVPKLIRRSCKRPCSNRRTFDLEIEKDPKPKNFIQNTTTSSVSSNSSSPEVEISFASFEKDLEQENFYEEINKILTNDFLFDFDSQNVKMPKVPKRPENPFFKNFKEEEKE